MTIDRTRDGGAFSCTNTITRDESTAPTRHMRPSTTGTAPQLPASARSSLLQAALLREGVAVLAEHNRPAGARPTAGLVAVVAVGEPLLLDRAQRRRVVDALDPSESARTQNSAPSVACTGHGMSAATALCVALGGVSAGGRLGSGWVALGSAQALVREEEAAVHVVEHLP